MILQERIQNTINTEVGEEQFGIHTNNIHRKAIVICLMMLIAKYTEIRKKVYVCFIDYNKPFDRVKHENLV